MLLKISKSNDSKSKALFSCDIRILKTIGSNYIIQLDHAAQINFDTLREVASVNNSKLNEHNEMIIEFVLKNDHYLHLK